MLTIKSVWSILTFGRQIKKNGLSVLENTNFFTAQIKHGIT